MGVADDYAAKLARNDERTIIAQLNVGMTPAVINRTLNQDTAYIQLLFFAGAGVVVFNFGATDPTLTTGFPIPRDLPIFYDVKGGTQINFTASIAGQMVAIMETLG